MQLAMIIFLLCWITGMARQFIHMRNTETLADECAETGICLIWVVIGLGAIFAYTTLNEMP